MTTREIYLNHAGTSWPKPQAVLDAVQESLSVPPSCWAESFDQAHHAIADFFCVEQLDQILLTPGCTSAIAVGIGDALIPDGKRILTSRWEHHSLHRPLLKHMSAGIKVDYIPPVPSQDSRMHLSPIDLNWLEKELSNEDVGLIAMTAACNVTGELMPIEEVIRLAHRFDALVMIDAAQIVGWLELDFPKLGADMVAFGGHKGLQAPWGIGGLYMSDRARMECVSASCELPAHSNGERQVNPRPGYCDVGSVDQVALSGLRAATDFLSPKDTGTNLEKARQQIQRIGDELSKIDSIEVMRFGNNGMPTIALKPAGLSSAQLAKHLSNYRITVGSGFQCAPLVHETLGTQESGLVRLSVGIEQSDDDIDEVMDRLNDALSGESLSAIARISH